MSGIVQALFASQAAAPYTLQFQNAYTSTADASSYTFSSVDFGAAGSTREIFVQLVATTATSRTVSSITIGGVAATLATSVPSSSSSSQTCAFATVPSGTTGDVVVTMSGACTGCFIAVYRVESRPGIGTNHSDYDTVVNGSSTSNALSTVTAPANGFILGNMLITSGTASSITSDTFTLSGGAFIESNYRAGLSYSRIGSTSLTPTNTVTWVTSAANRQTAWAYS